MELFRAIFEQELINGDVQITFRPNCDTIGELIEGKCYQALKKIRAILDDDSLSDEECFMRIEQIVCVLEELGSDGGCRHDFG